MFSKNLLALFYLLTAMLSVSNAYNMPMWRRQDDGGLLGGLAGALTTGSSDTSTTETSTTDSSTTPTTTATSTTPTETTTSASATSTTQTTTAPPTTSASVITDNGSTSTAIVTLTSLVSGSTTATDSSASATSTAPGDLPANSGGSSSSGISDSNKKIALGVGIGVGGAIVLGAIAVIAWRLWGRNRHNPEEDHFLMDEPLAEKPPTANSGASPFQSTLDQYHNPAGRLNTASNF